MQALKRERIISAGAAIALQLGVIAALLWGLGVDVQRVATSAMTVLPLRSVPPPPATRPPPEPPRQVQPKPAARPSGPEGAAAPPGLKATPLPREAPRPIVPPPIPLPPAAPVAGTGVQASAGASDVPGPGTGAGGEGNGLGSGRGGGGTGGGGGMPARAETPPRCMAGCIGPRDYRVAVDDPAIRAPVAIRYAVQTDGRATDCVIRQSSGSRQFDGYVCHLIETRARFRPGLDGAGRPVLTWLLDTYGFADRP